MDKWKFADKPDTVCVTSSDVVERRSPILYCSHEVDEDGDVVWQFHFDPNNFDFEKAKLVRLDTMIKLDPSLVELSYLPVGSYATRTSEGSPWGYYKSAE